MKTKAKAKSKAIPITVTFRHIEPTDALRTYAEKKLSSIVTLVPGATDAHVVLSATTHHHRQLCEITVHGGHTVLNARDETDDLYAAIDLATAKLDRQVRRLKGKMIEEPRRSSSNGRRASSTSPA